MEKEKKHYEQELLKRFRFNGHSIGLQIYKLKSLDYIQNKQNHVKVLLKTFPL